MFSLFTLLALATAPLNQVVAPSAEPLSAEQVVESGSLQADIQTDIQANIQADTQTIAQADGNIITMPQAVRSLPGSLNNVPVFNSNSPEIIEGDGILLSTFPSRGKARIQTPTSTTPLTGASKFFSHHVARGTDDRDTRTIYEGIMVHNPGDRPITLTIRNGASYISQESPWNAIKSNSSNLYSNNFSGPGSRVMNEVLRGRRQAPLPSQVTIPPRESHLLLNAPIPLRRLNVPTDGTLAPGSELTPPPTSASSGEGARLNGRSTLIRLDSSGPVYVASLAMHAPQSGGKEYVPTLESWKAASQKTAN